jgi:hypothetical protein
VDEPRAGQPPASDTLAEQALNNLVNQFARPLDFLRELVQNAIDAGSPRVEVWVQYVPPRTPGPGVLEIHVDDFGEGMDEGVIDNHLTRLFSSTKEDDLTKIGKFGIGFTSIFAIEPDAVLLRTSRHGESWELLFHPDRSFDKVRSDKLVDGTKITLFKRMPRGEVEPYVRDMRWILGWWCAHSDTPVTFWDRTHEEQLTAADSADPFAQFAEAGPGTGPETINQPMLLVDSPLSLVREDAHVQAVVGYDPAPRYGYYNGGLTLVNTRNRDVLGLYERRLSHLSFKLKSNTLEHTLTRDNVLQDAHWDKAMKVLVQAADALRSDCVDQTEASLRSGGTVHRWHAFLAQECRSSDGPGALDPFRDRAMFRDTRGRPRTLEQVEDQEDDQGCVLLSTDNLRLDEALDAEGVFLLEDSPETRELLAAAWRPPLLGLFGPRRELRSASEIYVIPDLIVIDTLPPRERLLVNTVAGLLDRAVGWRVKLKVGQFGGSDQAREQPLAMEGPFDGRVFQRPEASWLRIPAFLRSRCILLNRHHGFFQLQTTASVEDLDLAAYALAQALLHTEDNEGDRAFRKLIEAAAEA